MKINWVPASCAGLLRPVSGTQILWIQPNSWLHIAYVLTGKKTPKLKTQIYNLFYLSTYPQAHTHNGIKEYSSTCLSLGPMTSESPSKLPCLDEAWASPVRRWPQPAANVSLQTRDKMSLPAAPAAAWRVMEPRQAALLCPVCFLT